MVAGLLILEVAEAQIRDGVGVVCINSIRVVYVSCNNNMWYGKGVSSGDDAGGIMKSYNTIQNAHENANAKNAHMACRFAMLPLVNAPKTNEAVNALA